MIQLLQYFIIFCIVGFIFQSLVDKDWEEKKDREEFDKLSTQEQYQAIWFGNQAIGSYSYCLQFSSQSDCLYISEEDSSCTWEWDDGDGDGKISNEYEGYCH